MMFIYYEVEMFMEEAVMFCFNVAITQAFG